MRTDRRENDTTLRDLIRQALSSSNVLVYCSDDEHYPGKNRIQWVVGGGGIGGHGEAIRKREWRGRGGVTGKKKGLFSYPAEADVPNWTVKREEKLQWKEEEGVFTVKTYQQV
jgi:hypothetical protein